MIDKAALRALCDGATPGPWYSHNPDDEYCMNAYVVSTSPVEPNVDRDERTNSHAEIVAITLIQTPRLACHADDRWAENAAFIAAARTAIPDLLDALDARDAENEKLLTALRFVRFYLGGQSGDHLAENEEALRFNTEHALKIIHAAVNGEPIDPALSINIRMK